MSTRAWWVRWWATWALFALCGFVLGRGSWALAGLAFLLGAANTLALGLGPWRRDRR